MDTPKRYRPWLTGLSLGVVLALLIWPSTRWLVQSQMEMIAHQSAGELPLWTNNINSASETRLHETAERVPDDYRLQLADAITYQTQEAPLTPEIKMARLRDLTARFPNSPSLYATILRHGALQVRIPPHQEKALIAGDLAPSRVADPKEPEATPKQIAVFDRDAAIGESLDPDNAYFPLMRAVGLFAARRVPEGLAAIEQAAQKSQWNEYYDDEVNGEERLQEETFGHVNAFQQTAIGASILFPHMAPLRSISRIALAKAGDAEKAGRIEEGLAIRAALLQCGSLMRVQSHSLIGNLVGIAITHIAIARPGGSRANLKTNITENNPKSEKLTSEQQVQFFDKYLQQVGHTELSAEAHAEIAAGDRAREIAVTARDCSPFGRPLTRLAAWWATGLLLLSTAVWMLLLGGAATLLGRHRRIRTGQGLPAYVSQGITFSLFAAIAGAAAAILTLNENGVSDLAASLAAIIPFGVIVLLLPGRSLQDRLRTLGAFGLSLLTIAALVGAYAWHTKESFAPLMRFGEVLFNLSSEGPGNPTIPLFGLALGIVAAIPLLTLLTFAVLSLVWRVPLSVGLARGFQGCAAPIACLLLVAYGLIIPITLRYENIVSEGVQHTVQHEGRYIAELNGKEWPGPTR